jgi:hypothetical protein
MKPFQLALLSLISVSALVTIWYILDLISRVI